MKPRLSHAKTILSARVPAPGAWQQGQMDARDSLASVTEWLKTRDLPAVFMGEMSLGLSPGVSGWSSRKTSPRQTFTDTEIFAAGDVINPSGLVVGPGWQKNPVCDILDLLSEELPFPGAVDLSVSAGLFAENLLCSLVRPGSGKKWSPILPWIAAADRIATLPAWVALTHSGATPHHAYAGQVLFDVPKDPEVISATLQALWECGMHLPLGDIINLSHMDGVAIPQQRVDWGGTEDGYFMAKAIHTGRRSLLWSVDDVLLLPKKKRADALKEIFQK